jgi:hypothetical protein
LIFPVELGLIYITNSFFNKLYSNIIWAIYLFV